LLGILGCIRFAFSNRHPEWRGRNKSNENTPSHFTWISLFIPFFLPLSIVSIASLELAHHFRC
jgi:hypothetical protein